MEMDIYMRRRLVALGGLVAFFILFVLLIRSCGGDDEPTPIEPAGGTSEPGAVAALSLQDYIPAADDICGPANRAVGALDPSDPTAVARQEARITGTELRQLQGLELAEQNRQVQRFLTLLSNVVDALRSRAEALERGDTVTADEAQVEVDTNEAEARSLGEQIGFTECGQFLDAGQAPSEGGADATGTEAPTDTGTVAPTETTPAAPTETTPAAPTETTPAPPADDTGGGITP